MRRNALWLLITAMLCVGAITASLASATGNDNPPVENHQGICHAIPASAVLPEDVDHWNWIVPATVGVLAGHLAQHPQDFTADDESFCTQDEEPVMVEVCDPETGEVISVDEEDADQYLPVDDEACADEEEPPPPPDEPPTTGIDNPECPVGSSDFKGKCYKNDSQIQPNGDEIFGEQG